MMPRLIWGGLTGSLPIESWPEAREALRTLHCGTLGSGLLLTCLGLFQVPFLPTVDQIDAFGAAMIPTLFGVLLTVTLFSPVEAHLSRTYEAWQAALKEALTPPELLPRATSQTEPVRRHIA